MTYSTYLASRNYQPAPVIRTEKREGDLVLERGKIHTTTHPTKDQ